MVLYLYSWFRWRYEVLSICRSDWVINLFPFESRAVRFFEIISPYLRRAVGHGRSAWLASWVCGVRRPMELDVNMLGSTKHSTK